MSVKSLTLQYTYKNNILITDRENAVIADFGIPKVLEDRPTGLTTSSWAQGTIRYCSPELVTNSKPQHSLESDIWALGCLILEVSELVMELMT